MTVSSTTAAAGSTREQAGSTSDAFQNVGMDDFIQLMITELQNQDPMNPMDNAQMLEQINQIREISSNDRLSDTLEAVLLGQGLATANNMIGKMVVALDDESTLFAGEVDHIAIEDGIAKLRVLETLDDQTFEHTVSLNNVSLVSANKADVLPLAEQLALANALVGHMITGVADDSETVSGIVRSSGFADGRVKLHLDNHVVDLENVTDVVEENTSS